MCEGYVKYSTNAHIFLLEEMQESCAWSRLFIFTDSTVEINDFTTPKVVIS